MVCHNNPLFDDSDCDDDDDDFPDMDPDDLDDDPDADSSCVVCGGQGGWCGSYTSEGQCIWVECWCVEDEAE